MEIKTDETKKIQRKSKPGKSIASACGADAAYRAGHETDELEGCQVAQAQLNKAPKSKTKFNLR